MKTLEKCERCEGTGVVAVANGPDDFDHEFCSCEKGKDLEDKTDEELNDFMDARSAWLNEVGRKEGDVLIDEKGDEYVNDDGEFGMEKRYLPDNLQSTRKPF